MLLVWVVLLSLFFWVSANLPLRNGQFAGGVLTSLPPLRHLLPNLPTRLLQTPYVPPPYERFPESDSPKNQIRFMHLKNGAKKDCFRI